MGNGYASTISQQGTFWIQNNILIYANHLLQEWMAGGHDDLGHPPQCALWPPPPPSTPENRPDTPVGTNRQGMGDAHPFLNKLVHVDRTFRRDEKNSTMRRYSPPRSIIIPVFDAARRWVPPHSVVFPVFDATSRYLVALFFLLLTQ